MGAQNGIQYTGKGDFKSSRTMLIMVCKDYRTLSGDALKILTGITTIQLKARERKEIYMSRERRNNTIYIKVRFLTIWEVIWNNSGKGRPLHMLCPNVQDRIKLIVEIRHYNAQFLIAHSNLT